MMTNLAIARKLLCLALLLATASLAPAQKFKVATVDFNRLITSYYVYQQAIEEKQVEVEAIREEDFGRQERIKALKTELEKMILEINDSSLSAARRQAVQQAAKSKEADLQALVRERDVFLETSDKNLNQKMNALQDDINNTVAEAVREYAETQEVDFVFDETGRSLQQVPFLIYVRNRIDLTDAVLEILNKDAPKSANEEKADEDANK